MEEIENAATDGAGKTASTEQPQLASSKPWLEAIKHAEEFFKPWQEACDNIDKHFANLDRLRKETASREMQMFWANMEVIKPSIYARPPVPVVGARFKDRKPLVRHASEVLERSMVSLADVEDLDGSLTHVRDDLSLYGRGVPWLRYTDKGGAESAPAEHIDRKDFLHGPARKWREVPWVAKRAFLTREEMRERFEEASGVAYQQAQYREKKSDAERDNYKLSEKQTFVWEIWSKATGEVLWVSPGVDVVLDQRPPLLELESFYPCPKPAFGTLEPGTLRPVPDFLFYKDQIEEVIELTARISALAEALKLKGFYAAGAEDVAEAVEKAFKDQSNNAVLIPVANMPGVAAKDAVVWLPVEEVARTITHLVQLRREVISDIYQITGISDIMRGETDASETLGAQQLKSQYGSVRIRSKQNEMVRIGRDVFRIQGEIASENFEVETFLALSQYDEIPRAEQIEQQIMQIREMLAQAQTNPEAIAFGQQNPEQAAQMVQQAQGQIQQLEQQITMEQVVEFLQNGRMRPFTLDIETDSTIMPDENAAKQRTSEFLGVLGPAVQQLGDMVATQPATAAFAGEVIKFAVKPFRAGRSLDEAVDELVEQMKQVAAQPKPDPNEADKIKAQSEAKAKETDAQTRQMEAQNRAQEAQAKASTEAHKARIEELKAEAVLPAELEKTEAEIEKIQAETARIEMMPASGGVN